MTLNSTLVAGKILAILSSRMRNLFFVLGTTVIFMLLACAPRPATRMAQNQDVDCPGLEDGLSGVATDTDYAYTMEKAVRVGGGDSKNELKYLQMFLGPNREFLDGYFKVGNFWGNGLTLSGYKVILNGDTVKKTIYLDPHHCKDPKAPSGFTVRDQFQESGQGRDNAKGKAYVPARQSVSE